MINRSIIFAVLIFSNFSYAKKCHFAFKCYNDQKDQIVYQSSSAEGVKNSKKYCIEDKKNLCSYRYNSQKLSGCATDDSNLFIDNCAILVCETFGLKDSYRLGREIYSEDEIKSALYDRMNLMQQAGDCKL